MTLLAHFDAGELALSNNDPVALWEDLAASYDLVQDNAGDRPIFRTGILNGLPAVEFDSQKFFDGQPVAAIEAPVVWLAVLSYDFLPTDYVTLVSLSDAGFDLFWGGNELTFESYGPGGDPYSFTEWPTADDPGVFHLLAVVFGGPNAQLREDGVQKIAEAHIEFTTTGNVAWFVNEDFTGVGLNSYYGKVCELKVYQGFDLSELEAIEAELLSKYGL